MTRRCCLLHLIKRNCLLKTFLGPQILMTQDIYLPVFPSRTNLKVHNISVTSKLVKKVTANLDFSNFFGPDSIPVVVLKNCEFELSHIQATLCLKCAKCLKESCFPYCWKASFGVPVFKNLGKRCMAKHYCPFSLLLVVSKVFEKV